MYNCVVHMSKSFFGNKLLGVADNSEYVVLSLN